MASWFTRQPLEKLFLFLHIPKCAGTTLVNSLGSLGSKRFVVVSESPDSKEQALKDLYAAVAKQRTSPENLDVISGHDVFYGMHEVSRKDPFYFTVLRDPMQRYISHYRHFVDCACVRDDVKNDYFKKVILEDGHPISLAEFARRLTMTNVMTNYLAAANHPDRTSKRWQVTDPDELLAMAKDCLRKMNWIGFVERFPEDLDLISKLVQVKSGRATNQSISEVDGKITADVEEQIRHNNSLDYELYRFAVQLREKSSEKNE